jgi:hypothetical protein
MSPAVDAFLHDAPLPSNDPRITARKSALCNILAVREIKAKPVSKGVRINLNPNQTQPKPTRNKRQMR